MRASGSTGLLFFLAMLGLLFSGKSQYFIKIMEKFKDTLPIDALLPELRQLLQQGHVVLSSPPGSGKTTRVPLALLDEDWLQGSKIIMLEPRRPAARMAAYRMATQLNERVGQAVGYQVRLDRKISPDTRIEVLTEALLTRRLQSDPELTGVGLVIFDEFHERSLQADLGLALSLDVCGALRPDLRLLIMSATLDEVRVARLIEAEVLAGDGGLYPVEESFLSLPVDEVLKGTVKQVLKALGNHDGDLLVFLPGVAEIGKTQTLLEGCGLDVDIKVCMDNCLRPNRKWYCSRRIKGDNGLFSVRILRKPV